MAETAEGRTTRETILAAASEVVLTEGVASLTLDEVARVAGISKGGLLYHFRSKSALIAGMLTNLVDQFERALEQELQNEGEHPGPGAWHRAYVRATFYHEQ